MDARSRSLSLSLSLCFSLSLSSLALARSFSLSLYIYIYIHLFVSLSLSVSFLPVPVHLCISVSVPPSILLYMYAYLYRIYIYIYIFVYFFIYFINYTCRCVLHVYIDVYTHTCLRNMWGTYFNPPVMPYGAFLALPPLFELVYTRAEFKRVPVFFLAHTWAQSHDRVAHKGRRIYHMPTHGSSRFEEPIPAPRLVGLKGFGFGWYRFWNQRSQRPQYGLTKQYIP